MIALLFMLGVFSIDPSNGEVTLTGQVNSDIRDLYVLVLVQLIASPGPIAPLLRSLLVRAPLPPC